MFANGRSFIVLRVVVVTVTVNDTVVVVAVYVVPVLVDLVPVEEVLEV